MPSPVVAPLDVGTAAAATAYAGYKTFQALNRIDDGYDPVKAYKEFVEKFDAEFEEEQKEKYNSDIDKKGKGKKPPYNGQELGADPTKSPGKGFEWKGKGPPGSGKGSWYNESTKESLHPDFNHPPPMELHWDYVTPDGIPWLPIHK